MHKGSALIIAIFIISLIGGVAFSIGKLIFLETAISSNYENGVFAFYAAESGLEEGFLRYRYNQDSEYPTGWSGDTPETIVRSNLDDSATVPSNTNYASPVLAANQQVYDLGMGSVVTSLGLDINGSGAVDTTRIQRDEAKKFRLINLAQNDTINFSFKPVGAAAAQPVPLNNGSCALIEVKIIGKRVNSTSQTDLMERKTMLYNSAGSCNYSGILSPGTESSPYNLTTTASLDLKAAVWGPFSIYDGEISIKPIGSDIAYFMNINNGGKRTYGNHTYIQSTGYHGGIKRGMEADIDRQSGTLYDLFDYVAYKNS